MRKFFIFSVFLTISLGVLVGCSNSQNGVEEASEVASGEQLSSQQNIDTHEVVAVEPTDEHTCAFCDMKVYGMEHEMGVFTAQIQMEDGEHYFFDDVGCLLNYERGKDEQAIAKWVRDYNSSEWIDLDGSVPVKADIITPMKYGYALFNSEKAAQTFVDERKDINAVISSWDEIDHVSHERYMKKMGQNEEGHDGN
ncbi:nitrous oxide reductase accessory protein NosL [Bacillus sp. SCS-151]|uniref:nitrous oxide reductase accessory protein NosL n=1 Tax=Nanhaiella sioensis TaxID=3115293 RepID=UPI00397E732F